MTQETDDVLVVSVKRACEMLACSKPTLYGLLRKRALASYRDGAARKIELASIKAYVARKLAENEGMGRPMGR